MNGKEHYLKAEDLLGQAARAFDFPHIQALAQRAQAHATLAQVEATLIIAAQLPDSESWGDWNGK